MTLDEFLADALFVDLETTPAGEVLAIGATLRGVTFRREKVPDPTRAFRELDAFARDARFVVGHNVVRHDLSVIERIASGLPLLAKPVIDTLYLSPLAFPTKPYHHLVKDYKLVSDSRNDPVADARQSRVLLVDEWNAFATMGRDDATRLSIYAACFDDGEAGSPLRGHGTKLVFDALGAAPLAFGALPQLLRARLGGKACLAGLDGALAELSTAPAERPAIAYAVAWIAVSETRSVLPPWVRRTFPATMRLLKRLRDVSCGRSDCAWCSAVHDPTAELKHFFKLPSFRPVPTTPDGRSLQEAVVRCGMNGRSHLAVLPTGAGKSLCYQVPALARYRRRNSLTIVISPLQALMKDQVDGLERRVSGGYAAALNGLLTPPDRADVMDRVADGEVALLYVAPEQLRNESFRKIIRQREIECWVFDEAHCLSKWGHDFRTDYLYAARFIGKFCRGEGLEIPQIACFTATAKRDVKEEIVEHFRKELGVQLDVFDAGAERTNLRFHVRPIADAEKRAQVDKALREFLPDAASGSGIVYTSTRLHAEELAESLRVRGWQAAAFHAGLPAPEKRRVQEAFLGGEHQVICATNAFGMGIDKENVRIVVHADVPGSLENYLQEAGRAGRDGRQADCVLLHVPSDLETQFGLCARSQLTQRDIEQILFAIRRARRKGRSEVVVTAGELLRDPLAGLTIDPEERDATTKVRAAVAWLERAKFVERNENHTRVFQGRPRVRDMAEAEKRLDELDLPPSQRKRWLAILRALMNTAPEQGLDMDELAHATGFWRRNGSDPRDEDKATPGLLLLRTLHAMSRRGLIEEGLLLTAFVRHKVAGASLPLSETTCTLERALLDLMSAEAPDAGPERASPVHLRLVNEELRRANLDSRQELLARLLASLCRDTKGLAGRHRLLSVRHEGDDRYGVRLHADWTAVRETAALRHRVAAAVLGVLLGKTDPASKGEVLVAFAMTDLHKAIEADAFLKAEVADPVVAATRALMFLHDQRVIHLQQGLAVFRQAMSIRVLDKAHGRRYSASHYAALAHHYAERIFQVHVMGEYADLGASGKNTSRRFERDYFQAPKDEFVRRWFRGKEEAIKLATSRESYRRIVDALGSSGQQRLVTWDDGNLLVLAGPGSGKTRVIVHRCAYLLLVKRVAASSILVLCFNRNAAHQIRRRLRELVGDDARGVQVHTYHGLALRLTGRSLSVREGAAVDEKLDFDAILDDANRLLRGETTVAGFEPDELRERLLAGYEHVLVDEYQDIDRRQYDLVQVIAKRAGDAEQESVRATLFAVGDDDQNIYGFREANVEFLRRFREDYAAPVEYLVENYRSTGNIVAAANRLIAANRDRMKTEHPIRVNDARRRGAPGGRFDELDTVARGRVQLVRVRDRPSQVAALASELRRLKDLDADASWSDFAILARSHAEIAPFRAYFEELGIPVRRAIPRSDLPPLHRFREIAVALQALEGARHEDLTTAELRDRIQAPASPSTDSAWVRLLDELLREWDDETAGKAASVSDFIAFVYETLEEQRRGQFVGEGVFLATVHSAKGTEFQHVFLPDGGWEARPPKSGERRTPAQLAEEERRTYYVALTRAKETLCLFQRADCANPHLRVMSESADETRMLCRDMSPADLPSDHVLRRRYDLLGFHDLYLDFAGRRPDDHPIHRCLAALRSGDPLRLERSGESVVVLDTAGNTVAQLSQKARERWRDALSTVESVHVFAVARRARESSKDEFRDAVRTEEWEVPIVEVVWLE